MLSTKRTKVFVRKNISTEYLKPDVIVDICEPPPSTCDPEKVPFAKDPNRRIIYHPAEIPASEAPYCITYIGDRPSYNGLITSYFTGPATIWDLNLTEPVYPQFKERRQHPRLKNAEALFDTMFTNHRAHYLAKVESWLQYYKKV